ncbi:universal stress protein [Haloplanus aerogenes]|uniref:Nucleotide-binding universal stress UspA family protein n=1 Tax=Haloplanus aerogenes TaxID=660522 RepID=A0A3M0DU09_9EURY|nr:universal stress protein [Haloplanus aerogenes]AZH25728.1 universal stress protein [Haloplanus aerogenes]RMB25461.1 nucleotide-binding universal stress UspA family protein [Haloplanus aerogenes]
MYDTILIPTDGSDAATTAARYGLVLAERVDATVHVLSVVDPDRVVTDAVGDVDDLVRRQRALLSDRARDAVERVEAEAPASIDIRTHVVEDRPARALATAIDDYDADLVAMGTHGRSGVDRYLFGSLAERTLRTAHVPVLAVREADVETDPTVETILVATDGSEAATRAGDHAVAVAAATGARLHALTVGDDEEPARRLANRARETGVDASAAVRTGHPHEAIREYAETVDADLVVLGTHGRSGVERVLLGSVAERTLRTATRPVLVVGP